MKRRGGRPGSEMGRGKKEKEEEEEDGEDGEG